MSPINRVVGHAEEGIWGRGEALKPGDGERGYIDPFFNLLSHIDPFFDSLYSYFARKLLPKFV